MEARVIKNFFPVLVTAIGDCIHSVTDQCLAKGLLSDSTYRKILHSTGTSDDKARTLLSCVMSIMEGDDSSTCFGTFLSALNESLPPGSKSILNKMSCKYKEVVPLGQSMVFSATEVSRRCVTQQESLSFFGRFEDNIRRQERARAEQRQLEEEMENNIRRYEGARAEQRQLEEEMEKLKHEFKCQTPAYLIATTHENRISANEGEIKELKSRMEEVESVMEDHGMKSKRGRSKMSIALFEHGMVHDGISHMKEGSRKREEQASQLSLAERGEQYKLLILQKKEEELRKKEEEYQTHLEETIQKEIEHRKTEDMHKTILQQLEAKHQKALEVKEAELHERVQDQVQIERMKLQMALQDKDLKIKDLELKNSELLMDGRDQKLKDLEPNGLAVHNGDVHVQDKVQLQPSPRKKKSRRKFKWFRPFRKKSDVLTEVYSALSLPEMTIKYDPYSTVSKVSDSVSDHTEVYSSSALPEMTIKYDPYSTVSKVSDSVSDDTYAEIDELLPKVNALRLVEPPCTTDEIYDGNNIMTLDNCWNSEAAQV